MSAPARVSSASSGASSDTAPEPIPAAPQAEPINPDPTKDDLKRRGEIDRAWSAYRGEFPEIFKTQSGATPDDVRPNRCASIIDKGVAWLFGKEIKLTVNLADEDGVPDDDDEARPQPTPAAKRAAGGKQTEAMEAALRRVWGSTDDMLSLLTMAAMNGGVSGHVFLKIVWDSERMRYPRFAVLDSHNLYVIADPDDCNRAVCYVIEYTAHLGMTSNGQRRTVTKRQVIALVDPDGEARYGLGGEDDDDYWTITNWLRYDTSGDVGGQGSASALLGQQQRWQQMGAPMEWRYPFPPIVDAMNLPNPNEYWGLPDLPPALIDLNERIQFIESNIAKIIKSHAHPWLFASGCDPSAIRNEPGVVQGLPSPESKVWAVSATGDLDASMRFANTLRADMDEQSRVPAVALGRQEDMPTGNISGIALELLFQPLIEKTELKRRLYGQLIRKASACALALLGLIDDCDDVEVDLGWSDLLPNDDLAMAQTAVAMQQLGYSKRTLIEQTGGDPDVEAENQAEESQTELANVMKGQGMPPAPPTMTPPDFGMGAPMGATPPPPTSPPPVNHPAAVVARARVKAAFGKA